MSGPPHPSIGSSLEQHIIDTTRELANTVALQKISKSALPRKRMVNVHSYESIIHQNCRYSLKTNVLVLWRLYKILREKYSITFLYPTRSTLPTTAKQPSTTHTVLISDNPSTQRLHEISGTTQLFCWSEFMT